MNRPYVICHLLTSLDGRISGSFFRTEETAGAYPIYARTRKTYTPQAAAVWTGRFCRPAAWMN